MATDSDWYPNIRPQQRIMYENVMNKLGGFQAKYGLTAAMVGRVVVMCETLSKVLTNSNKTARRLCNCPNGLTIF